MPQICRTSPETPGNERILGVAGENFPHPPGLFGAGARVAPVILPRAMDVLVTGASGAVGAELLAPLARAGHGVRALTRDPARVADAGVAEVVRGDLVTGDGLAERARRRRAGLLPRALDGDDGRGGRRVRRARAPGGRRLRRRGGAGGGAPDRLPRRAGARGRAALAAPGQPPRGRAHAAGRRARGGGAAGLDRRRRPFALVPLPRSARRADAVPGAARLARQPHPPDRRARRHRLPARRRARRRPSTGRCRWTSPGPTR